MNIKLHPIALIDPKFPCIEPSVEIRKDDHALQLSWGFNYDFYTMLDNDSAQFPVFGNRFRIGIRHYLRPEVISGETYLGLSVYKTSYRRGLDNFEFDDKETGRQYYFAYGIINKTAYGAVAQAGYILNRFRRFSLELAIELGVRSVNAYFTELEGLREQSDNTPANNAFDLEYSKQGRTIKQHVGCDLNLRYRIF